jgi:hypothetical protein
VARTTRLLTLPMLVLFVAPAPVHRGLGVDLPWYPLVSGIAGAWVLLAGRLVGGPGPRAAPPRPPGRRTSVHVRFAAQSALGLALAFAATQALFPDHWAWAILTAFAVSGGARSRGDVLLRSGERLVGAVAGTVAATLLAGALGGHTVASVVAIFALLAAGALLREVHYAFWAFCVTSVLALLYGVYGESGTHLPLHTEAVVRRYAALARDAIEAARADPGAVDHLDHRLALLESAARPALVAHRIARALGLRTHDATAVRVARVRAAASAPLQAAQAR